MADKIIREKERMVRKIFECGEDTEALLIWRRIQKKGQTKVHITEASLRVKSGLLRSHHEMVKRAPRS
jgi:hypothetical protein